MSLLIVEEVKKKADRGKRDIEKKFKAYQKINTTNRKSYKLLMLVPFVVKTFLKRRRLIQLTMGSKACVNLLSPSMFKCTMQGCSKEVPLKSFNNMVSIRTYLKTHIDGNDELSNEDCKVMLCHLKYLEESPFLNTRDNINKTNAELLAQLAEML